MPKRLSWMQITAGIPAIFGLLKRRPFLPIGVLKAPNVAEYFPGPSPSAFWLLWINPNGGL